MNAQNPTALHSQSSTGAARPLDVLRTPSLFPVRSTPTAAARIEHIAAVQPQSDAHTASRLLQCLHMLGYPQATLHDAQVLLDRHGENALRDVVRGAKRGEAGGLAKLGAWMLKQGIPPMPRVATAPEPPPFTTLGPPVQFVPVNNTPTVPLMPREYGSSTRGGEAHHQPNAPVSSGHIVRDQVKVFGGKAALTLVADVTRAGAATVTIEAAAALGGNERRYDWAEKIRFQLTVSELQLLTALLLGHLPTLHFKNHGDKWLRVAQQAPDSTFAGMIQVAIGQGSGRDAVTHTVAVDPSVLGQTISLFLRQAATALRLSTETVVRVLPAVSAAHRAQIARRAARAN